MALTLDGSASVTINSGAVLGITSGTAVATTSGTSIDFTGIPSWVKRITIAAFNTSTNGSSIVQFQLGTSGGVVTSGYAGAIQVGTVGQVFSTGFMMTWNTAAGDSRHCVATLINISGNTWVFGVNAAQSSQGFSGAGYIELSGTLNRVRLTTVNGTDTFDAGSINILYEG
jgi:hypothetical protein